jgi:hypothetical protein
MKNIVTEMKNLLAGLKSRFEQVEEWICLKMRQLKLPSQRKEKSLKKNEQSLRDHHQEDQYMPCGHSRRIESSKIKNCVLWSNNSVSQYKPKWTESRVSKRHLHTHNSITHNIQKAETTQMSITEWMNYLLTLAQCFQGSYMYA